SEREQRRIAHDLHDGLGQHLAGISCLTDALRRELENRHAVQAPQAAKISELLNSAVSQTRSLSRGLDPVVAEPNGLMSALEALPGLVTEVFKVTCEFVCSRAVLLDDNVAATHVYRIAQEAVANAIKHGRAQKIEIALSSEAGETILRVSDDGVGL